MSKVKKIIFSLSVACIIACSGLNAFAVTVINAVISQPQVTDRMSYVEVFFSDTFAYCLYVISENPDYIPVVIDNGTGLTIQSSSVLYGYGCDVRNGYFYTLTGSGSSTNTLTFSVSTGLTIKSVRVFGNIRNRTSYQSGEVSVVYGEDSKINEFLNTIVSLLQQQNNNTQSIISNANENADNIQSNDDKNTQAIIDNQNQLAEQEKTETQNSADTSVNDVSGSVPDKSEGMLSALQSLSNAISYTGTTAKWSFPQMYIPAISGVTDRINLNPEMEIDFTYWVNQIPQDIRTLISAIATIGLVIFAFKELYDLISYVLTLKGGGNNE